MQTKPSKRAVIAAFALAGFADLMQLPFTLASMSLILTGPSEILDFGLDAVVMGGLCLLLGFQVALVPALLAEWVPFIDILPIWTGIVMFIVWKQRKEQGQVHVAAQPRPAMPQGAVIEAEIVTPRPRALIAPPPLPAAPASPAQSSAEDRLQKLAALNRQQLITDEEYQRKRREVLEGL